MKNNSKVMNNHFSLGNAFYDIAKPAIFPNHILRFRNNRAAKLIGFDDRGKVRLSMKTVDQKTGEEISNNKA